MFRKKYLRHHNQPVSRLFLRVRHIQFVCIVGMLLLSGITHVRAQGGGQGGPPGQQGESGGRHGSRIIDDTTKQIYGPTTSRYYFEEDAFYNNKVYHVIDTVIRDFHKWTPKQKMNNLYQDLGNVGTDIRPIYYQVPDYIGANAGIHVYDLYWKMYKIRYYDTKSPYSNLKLSLGGKGRSMTDIRYARNINPRWNIGGDFHTMYVDKQVQRSGKGDRNVRSSTYDLFTSFLSKDSTYTLFANFKRALSKVYEYGGVETDTGDDGTTFNYADFFEDDASPYLTEAISHELRIGYHLFHQYEVGRALQFYHTFDWVRQGNQFIDDNDEEPDDYFDNEEMKDSTNVHDRVRFRAMRNEIGIKGNLLKLFYNGYYAMRNYKMEYKWVKEDTLSIPVQGAEHYIGGRAALQLDSVFTLQGWVEVQDNGNFRIEASLKSKWLEASLKQNKYSPGFVEQAYRGNHDIWSYNFESTDVTQLNGFIHYRSKAVTFSPGLTFTRLHNYVFFKYGDYSGTDQTVLPRQATDNIMASPEVRFSLTFLKHVTLRGQAIYSLIIENSEDALQVPELFLNGQLGYENIFFGGNLDLHAGVDVNWKSTYYALGYDVPVQQFYVQQTFACPSYPIIDIFVNGKIKRARIFVKYHNAVKALTARGDFPTPFYPGTQNLIDFGFDWSFYD